VLEEQPACRVGVGSTHFSIVAHLPTRGRQPTVAGTPLTPRDVEQACTSTTTA
jgi:hypothetical protein